MRAHALAEVARGGVSREMPIYEYRCGACGERFEKLVLRAESDGPVRCPRCGAVETRKQFSVFAAAGLERGTGSGACGSGGYG